MNDEWRSFLADFLVRALAAERRDIVQRIRIRMETDLPFSAIERRDVLNILEEAAK